MAETAVYLDIVALIPPAVGLTLIFQQRTIREVKAGTVVRASIYFIAAILFDILTQLGNSWAAAGTAISFFLLFNAVGFLATNLHYNPDSRSLKQSLKTFTRSTTSILYEIALLTWLGLTLYFQSPYLPANLLVWSAATIYPTMMFLKARHTAKAAHIRDMLTILPTAWFGLAIIALPLTLAGTGAPIAGPSLTYGIQLSFLVGSLFYYFMALAVTDPTGLTRPWVSRLVPQTIIEFGRRYLILHDTGHRTISFLSNAFRNMIESGSKVIFRTARHSWLMETLARSDPKFNDWVRTGKIVSIMEGETPTAPIKQAISERVTLGTTSTIFVRSLEPADLLGTKAPAPEPERAQPSSEIFLLESNRTPRPQLKEFLRRNTDLQVIDLSEPKDYFANLVNLKHENLHGSKILLEYDSSGDLGIVEKFFQEGIAYAEKCVLFTSKSSKLYRALKGKELIKIIAASSLVSAPDELPDGEVQIPDHELGLVTSIASDLLENNTTTAVRFLFDSIEDLIRGEHWEPLYSGVKQLLEMLSVPHATTIVLVNSDTAEPRFLGALRAIFPAQLKLDGIGLQVKKITAA